MKYGCPYCNEPKTDEERKYLGDNVTEIVVWYLKCFQKYHRTGSFYKRVSEFCDKEFKAKK